MTTVGLFNDSIVSPGYGKDISVLVSGHLPAVGQESRPKRPSSKRLDQARADRLRRPRVLPPFRRVLQSGTGSCGLSRRMRSRVARKSHRGTATSAPMIVPAL